MFRKCVSNAVAPYHFFAATPVHLWFRYVQGDTTEPGGSHNGNCNIAPSCPDLARQSQSENSRVNLFTPRTQGCGKDQEIFRGDFATRLPVGGRRTRPYARQITGGYRAADCFD